MEAKRTVSQLSKLTGINRRTIQYYANKKQKGKSGEGAGLIVPCDEDENGCRYFDDEALLTLLAYETFKQCGYEPKEIKKVLDPKETDFVLSADEQIAALEKTKREIDKQIEFVRILKALRSADFDDEDKKDEAMAALMSLLGKMMLVSFEEALIKARPDLKPVFEEIGFADAMASSAEGQKAGMINPLLNIVGHMGKGESTQAADSLLLMMEAYEDEMQSDAPKRAFLEFVELFNAQKSPKSKAVQQQVKLLVHEILPSWTLQDLEEFTFFITALMGGTEGKGVKYVAILAELRFGAGFAEYVSKSFNAYYANNKKLIKKWERILSSESEASQKANPDAAT